MALFSSVEDLKNKRNYKSRLSIEAHMGKFIGLWVMIITRQTGHVFDFTPKTLVGKDAQSKIDDRWFVKTVSLVEQVLFHRESHNAC